MNKKNSLKRHANRPTNRPNSLNTCLAVSKGKIDSFTKKNIFFCKLRKSTQTRAQFYADQMGVSIEQLFEALVENFVWVTMQDGEKGLTVSDLGISGGKTKRIQVQKYNEEVMVNNLGRHFSED